MPFSGFLAGVGGLNIFVVILVGAIGNLVGSLLAFWLGFWAKEHVIKSWIRRYGKYLLLTENEYDRSEHWFIKYGEKIVFFSRILPIVRTFISLPAGVSKMKIVKFSILTFVGSLLWSAALAYLGFYLGANWQIFEPIYRQFEYIIIGAFLLLVIWYVLRKIKHLRK